MRTVLVASFLVQWTQAYGSAGKPQFGMNSVPALRTAETKSHHSINGECLAVILVWVRYHSNRHCLAPGCINTKSVLPSFETATETITLWEKCFRPFNRHLAYTSLFDLTLAYTWSRMPMLYFVWTNRVLFHYMLSENWVKSMRYCQIQRNFCLLYTSDAADE